MGSHVQEDIPLNHAKYQPNSQKFLFSQWSKKDDTLNFYCSSLSLVQLVKDIPRFDCPSNFDLANGVKLYSSCDGLCLIGIWSKPDREQPSTLLIWNPSTGESTILPHSNFLKQLGYNSDDEDDDWGCTYGLAYDSTSDDYKVLRIDLSRVDNAYEILALKSCSWRRISDKNADCCLLRGVEDLAVVHGAFHWLGILSRFCVVSFNISYEVYGEIPLPEILCSLPLTYHLNCVRFDAGVSDLGGMLCVWYRYDDTFSLWAMKDYGVKESWVKLFGITTNGFYGIRPIYMFSDDKVLLSMRVNLTIRIVNRIISIGSSNRRWPLDCDDIDAITIDKEGIAYTESLISPRLGL